MYEITILTKDPNKTLVLKAEVRAQARAVQLVCKENGLPCEVTVEVAARVVKFKGA